MPRSRCSRTWRRTSRSTSRPRSSTDVERHAHDSHDPLRLDVDLGALRRNHERIVERLPAGTKLIYSVKANAYGHGVLGVVGELERLGVEGVATASISDAIRLRETGVECRILL